MILTTKDNIYVLDNITILNDKNGGNEFFISERYTTETHKLIDAQRPEYNISFAYKLVNNEWIVENQTLIDDYLKAQFKKTVPTQITPRQLRLQLLAIELLDEVEALCGTDRAMQIWFEYSLDFQRNDNMIISTAKQLGLTDEQIDNFFIEASKL